MKKSFFISLILLFVFSATTFADYKFPSPTPPGGKLPSEVKQYIAIIWDDNGYSGKKYTQYEDAPGATYANSSWIGGQINEGNWQGTKPNTLSIEEGDMGMSWASQTLAGIKPPEASDWSASVAYQSGSKVVYNDTIWNAATYISAGLTPTVYTGTDWAEHWEFSKLVDKSLTVSNPDGSQIHFTFNVITGLMIPTWPTNWQARESKFGYWKNQGAIDYPDGYPSTDMHSKLAIAWGREMQILESEGGKEFQQNYILKSYLDAKNAGHEIGNHTIDHMESNSPLAPPNDATSFPGTMAFFPNPANPGFEAWGGEGFDYSKLDTMPWGEVMDEAKLFGQKDGASAQYMGWKVSAGSYISKNTWKGAISLSEKQLDEYLDISVAKSNCYSFRAPRLEVSSGLYYALKDLGYLYDCGLEEGYEPYVDGTNFLWPYTVDNGSPNTAYQMSIGEKTSLDSMPAGLWEIPSNTFICHPDYRQETYNHHASINAKAADGEVIETFDEWVASGAKITGYDFNMYILWGMSKKAWLETMKYNTQLRLDGNKAPLQYGAHTDYYTPIYDNATLTSEFNRPGYGQVIDSGWNNWRDRVASMEEYVAWATAAPQNCYFVSGHELIDAIKGYQKNEKYGTVSDITDAKWEFFNNSALTSSATTTSYTGSITDAKITIDKASKTESPDAGYAYYFAAGTLDSLDHIQLSYKTTTPLILRLAMDGDDSWEVTLGNFGALVNSGQIPLSAFHYNAYNTTGTNSNPDPSKIIGIEFKLLTAEKEVETHTLSITNLKVYRGEKSVGTLNPMKVAMKNIALKSFTNTSLSLAIPLQGDYSVNIVSMNGKVVKSFNNRTFLAGLNRINLNNLSRGVYMISIKNRNFKKSIKGVIF